MCGEELLASVGTFSVVMLHDLPRQLGVSTARTGGGVCHDLFRISSIGLVLWQT